jgi:hypothetical protein
VSSLFAGNSTNASELLANMDSYLKNADPMNVREYRAGSNIVRVTYVPGHIGYEMTILRPLNDGTYEVITTHDEFTIAKISKNLNGNWN